MVQVDVVGGPDSAGESRYDYSTETAFSVVMVGLQTLVLAPVGVFFKVQLRLPLGDLAVTPRTALIGELTRVAVLGPRGQPWPRAHARSLFLQAGSTDSVVYSGTNIFLFCPSACPDLCCGGLLTPPPLTLEGGVGQLKDRSWPLGLAGPSPTTPRVLKPSNREKPAHTGEAL